MRTNEDKPTIFELRHGTACNFVPNFLDRQSLAYQSQVIASSDSCLSLDDKKMVVPSLMNIAQYFWLESSLAGEKYSCILNFN